MPIPETVLARPRRALPLAALTVRELVPRQVGAFPKASSDDVTKLSTAEGRYAVA